MRHICSLLFSSQFVFRSDEKSYYASMDHGVLLALVREYVDAPLVMELIGQYLDRTVSQGIRLGCPLSPVMAAIQMETTLDQRMEATGLFHARFMDDWVILAPTRWSLRRAVVIGNELPGELRVEKHPGKTFIGRIARGFPFLAYWTTEKGVTGVAPSTWAAFPERVSAL